MLAGELYIADDPELAADHRHCRRLVERFNATGVDDMAKRLEILRDLFGEFGEGAEIKPPLQCDYGYLIRVGKRTFINFGAIILDCAEVSIGDDVQVGPGVQLLTATHPLDAETRRQRWEYARPITIEDGVWLGAGVIVLPDVTIGENTVVGAGSVVTRDLPPGVLAVGNPCRVVRAL
jgi:maltose O-acetyltransferase